MTLSARREQGKWKQGRAVAEAANHEQREARRQCAQALVNHDRQRQRARVGLALKWTAAAGLLLWIVWALCEGLGAAR